MNNDPATPRICLDLADPTRQQAWRRSLEAAGMCCQLPTDATPVSCDLIVTDRPRAAADPAETAHGGAGPGVIFVGTDDSGDLCLPADTTERELALACRLFAETVRLRRQRMGESQARAALLRLALTDALTGLGNRRAWQEFLALRWQALRGTGMAICMAVLDLDQFKQLNDRCGHAAGDRALQITGEVLATEVRREDFVARLGGDEFGLFLAGIDPAATAAVVERVRAKLSERLTADMQRSLTASAGFALAVEPLLPHCDELLACADGALQAAKLAGRDRTLAANGLSATAVSGDSAAGGASTAAPRIAD